MRDAGQKFPPPLGFPDFNAYFFIFLSKVNSVQETCAKCFAVHLLKFEILQTTWKNKTKNIKMLNLLVKNWKLRVWCSLSYFFHVICKISNWPKHLGYYQKSPYRASVVRALVVTKKDGSRRMKTQDYKSWVRCSAAVYLTYVRDRNLQIIVFYGLSNFFKAFYKKNQRL